MHADLSDFASDSNPPSIRKTTVEAWRVPLPPVDLQRQFAAKADAVRGIAAQQTAALATAQATFDALLHQSFAVS
jgi:restriction endonuclease S subunit